MRPAHARLRAAALYVALAATLVPRAALAQPALLSIDDIYDPVKRRDFGANVTRGLAWLDDREFLEPRRAQNGRPAELLRVDATTGASRPFLDADRMQTALASTPGISADDAARLAHQASYELNAARTAILLTALDDLFVYDIASNRAVRLTSAAGTEEEATFSPNGAFVAFVRGGNLHAVDIATQTETALSHETSARLLNGKLDWVYEEEIYGRGTRQAYWWSPDSTRLAFLQIDDAKVPDVTVVDHIPYRQGLEVYAYPKAGDPNPTVRLGMVDVRGVDLQWASLDRYAGIEHLIVNVAWSQDSSRVAFSVQDREQTWLDLDLADPRTGLITTLLRETTPAWVNENGPPTYLPDGSFLWFSEKTGWKHLYHYRADGTLVRQVTTGKWEVRTLHGVDAANGWVYFSGTERSHIGSDVYRVRLDGSSLTRLSRQPGTHSATFSPGFVRYLDTWSDISTPPQVRVHLADGTEVAVVDANPVPALASYRLSTPEFLQVTTRDGFPMEAVMIKPPDFSPARKYPVFQYTYGGPHAPQVQNAWMGTTGLYLQLLAQHGIIVWICDNRTASGKGAESTWPIYKNFGELELRDVEDGLTWLKTQPYVDGARIGLYGWSYGGFMVTNALTHSKSFAMGIAGGSVTDWRDYDSIYTERYMLTPQHNADGYGKSSPRFAAKDLSGTILLVHGLMDDNVHPQNTVQFIYELQRAGKPFELMVYPKSRHGVSDPLLVKHLQQTMLDFTLKHLQPGPSAAEGASRK